MHMTRLAGLGLLVILLVIGGSALARQGVLKTRNGQTYEGDIEEKSDGAVITTKGIQTRVPKANIDSITYEKKDPQFQQRLDKLDKNDVNGRVKLAREAFDAGEYIFARDALEQALTIDPNNAEADRLRQTVLAQIRLQHAKERASAAPATQERAPVPRTAVAATTPAEQDKRFLKPADINTIRQAELREDETNVPIRFDRDVNRRYAKQLANRPPEEFLSLSQIQQAVEILKDGPPEMRQDVKIMRDPATLLEYRRTVQPYVLQNCATSQCHGGTNGGSLILFNPADSDQATYTNFYILQSYAKKGATSGGPFSSGKLMLIDRTQPIKSLLLQYSVPQQISDYDHPQVTGYRPPLRSLTDPRFVPLFNWIHDSLASVANYGINYTAPGAATHPATQEATQPAPKGAAR
jgi:tetratricopeptide (TPR) repeat protein